MSLSKHVANSTAVQLGRPFYRIICRSFTDGPLTQDAETDSAEASITLVPDSPSWSVATSRQQQDEAAATVLSKEEVQHVADLACLSLDVPGGISSDDIHKQLVEVLAFVKTIDTVDIRGMEPMWSPLEDVLVLNLREDVPAKPEASGEELFALAPHAKPPFYVAPKPFVASKQSKKQQ